MTADKEGSKAADKREVIAAASDWLAYLYSDDVTNEGRARFETWMKSSPEHAKAFRRADQVWRDLALVDAEQPLLKKPELRPEPAVSRNRRHFPTMIGAAIAASVMLVAAVSLLIPGSGVPSSRAPSAYLTDIGEIKTVTLEDGSLVTLDTATEMSVLILPDKRNIVLSKGRAFFDVAPDPSRPFIVDAGAGEARALGTEFTVSRFDGVWSVAVLEGSVSVQASGQAAHESPKASIVLQSGESARLREMQTNIVRGTFDIGAERQWMNGRLSYLDQPLIVVVRDINRYRTEPIIIGDERLNDLPVTMSLKTDETDQFISGLEATQPIRAQDHSQGVTLHPRS